MMKKTTLALVMTVFAASSCFSAFFWADGPHGQPSQQQWQQGHGGQGGQTRRRTESFRLERP